LGSGLQSLHLFIYRRLGRSRRPKDPTDTIRHIVEVMLREVATLPEPIPGPFSEHQLIPAPEPRQLGGADAPAVSLVPRPQLYQEEIYFQQLNCLSRRRPVRSEDFQPGQPARTANAVPPRSGTPGLRRIRPCPCLAAHRALYSADRLTERYNGTVLRDV
jgi:hypothetical protein